MADNKEYFCYQETDGNIMISEEVIAKIATSSAGDVTGFGGFMMNTNVSDYLGANRMAGKGIRIERNDNKIDVHLYIVTKYGYIISDVAKMVQSTVYNSLTDMVGDIVKAVHVHVGGISFNDNKER